MYIYIFTHTHIYAYIITHLRPCGARRALVVKQHVSRHLSRDSLLDGRAIRLVAEVDRGGGLVQMSREHAYE